MSLKVYCKPVEAGLLPDGVLPNGVLPNCDRVSAVSAQQSAGPSVSILRKPVIHLASTERLKPADRMIPLAIAVATELPKGEIDGGRRALLQVQKFLQTAAPIELQSLHLQAEDWLNMAAVGAASGQLSQAAAWVQQAVRVSQCVARQTTPAVSADASAIYAIGALLSGTSEVPVGASISLLQTAYQQYMDQSAILPAVSVLYHMALAEQSTLGTATALATLELAADQLTALPQPTELSCFYHSLINETAKIMSGTFTTGSHPKTHTPV